VTVRPAPARGPIPLPAPLRDAWTRGLGLLLAPWLLVALLLVGLPALLTLLLSLASWDGLTPPVFTGFRSYRMIASDPLTAIAVGNTLVFIAAAVPLRIAGALALALLLERPRRGTGSARVAAWLPAVVPDVAAALVWLWVFNPLFGPVNLVLGALGLPAPGWLAESSTAKVPFVVMAAVGLGEGLVVLLAALKGIPGSLREAAALDGAGRLRTFRAILLPLLVPWLLLLTVRDIIVGLQWTFVPALVMTGGDPYYATFFLPQMIREEAFDRFRYGPGSALIVVMTALALALAAGAWLLARGRGYTGAADDAG